MNLRSLAPCIAISMLGFAPLTQAHADTTSFSGNFTADNEVFTYDFNVTSPMDYTIATTSFATGGFDPVLTLFSSTGPEIDNDGSGASAGLSDASLNDVLGPGSYVLDLTEFPNAAIGGLNDGFIFSSDPTATGDNCGVAGTMFIDCISGAQRTSSYALTVNSTAAVTPEPSTWMLMLPGAAAIFYASRRRRLA